MLKIKMLLLYLMVSGVAAATEQPIVVNVVKQAGDWVVDYQLPEAVNQVYFYREGSLPRDGWRLSDPDLTLEAKAGQPHRIHTKSGQQFKHFGLRFASDYRNTPKDYELNFAFTDGGELLYTGHLLLALNETAKARHEFNITPAKGGQTIIAGQVYQQTQQWSDDELSGSYVYFGQAKPVSSEHMLAVIDPGLPAWISSRMAEDLPKLFAFYTKRTGMALNFTPVVFFTFTPSEKPGTQYSGGTLPGLVQLNVKGNDWHQQSSTNLIGVSHFLAHEAAHLWNSQLIASDDDRDASWIHEGGADAFAVRALVHLGVLSHQDLLREHEKFLNQCIEALQAHPVTAFEQHRSFQAFYHCGSTIAMLTEQAVKHKDNTADLFDFWATMMQRVSTTGLSLTSEQYFKSMLLAGHEQTLLRILTLLEEPQTQPHAFFSQAFQAAGLPLKSVNTHPRQASKAIKSVLMHLMMADCNSYSFNHHGSYFSVGAQLSCQQLKPQMQITHIMGLPVNQGHAVHAQVSQQCAKSLPVQLTINQGDKLELVCAKPLPELRPWLSLTAQ